MRAHPILTTAVALLMLAAAPGAVAEEEIVARLYKIEHLQLNEAGLLARQQCLDLRRPQCDYRVNGNGFIEFYTDLPGQAHVAEFLQANDVPPVTQVFQLTLLVATDAGEEMPPTLPESARQALRDLREFLPYRNYTLLDSGYLRTMGGARIRLGGDKGYEAALDFEGDPRSGQLQVERFELERRYRQFVPSGAGGGEYENVTQRVISSQFSMKVGETVVVGTSKLDGGEEALIVLLTAVRG